VAKEIREMERKAARVERAREATKAREEVRSSFQEL